MPLVGLSAHLIPYIMAMAFTMMFFRGSYTEKEAKPDKKYNLINEHLIAFNENTGSVSGTFHYNKKIDQQAESTHIISFCDISDHHSSFFISDGLFNNELIFILSRRGPPAFTA